MLQGAYFNKEPDNRLVLHTIMMFYIYLFTLNSVRVVIISSSPYMVEEMFNNSNNSITLKDNYCFFTCF